MLQNTHFLPGGLPKEPLFLPTPAPSTNGVHDTPETVIERIQAQTKYFNATFWREKLMACHVPPDAEAERWAIGIDRVATIFYTPGAGAAS